MFVHHGSERAESFFSSCARASKRDLMRAVVLEREVRRRDHVWGIERMGGEEDFGTGR